MTDFLRVADSRSVGKSERSLVVDTSVRVSEAGTISGHVSPATAKSRGRSGTLSQLVSPFLTVPSSPSGEKAASGVSRRTPAAAAAAPAQLITAASKAREEFRKLLAHVLAQLEQRVVPQTVWKKFKGTTGDEEKGPTTVASLIGGSSAAMQKTRDATFRSMSFTESDGDEENEGNTSTYFTDRTFELMDKLKVVLKSSRDQGCHVFYDGYDASTHSLIIVLNVLLRALDDHHLPNDTEKHSSFRFRRSSFQTSGRRSRSMSPGRTQRKSSSGLLSQCIAVLSSVVSEDCQYSVSSVRLMRPPYALQAVTLDVAQILVDMHRRNAKILHDIGFVLVPAFSTFPSIMHGRLLWFFESGILRSILHDLRRLQGGPSTVLSTKQNGPGRSFA